MTTTHIIAIVSHQHQEHQDLVHSRISNQSQTSHKIHIHICFLNHEKENMMPRHTHTFINNTHNPRPKHALHERQNITPLVLRDIKTARHLVSRHLAHKKQKQK